MDSNSALHDWARATGARFADAFLQQQGRDSNTGPRAYLARGLDRGGPLLASLREHAVRGLEERLAEIGGGRW